jgi:CDP-diacylglycerol--glycerol-3-phosphate 3-phosphatidyltransferase
VAVAAMFALGCGVQPAVAPWWAGVGAAVAAVLALAGLAQVLAAVRRALR